MSEVRTEAGDRLRRVVPKPAGYVLLPEADRLPSDGAAIVPPLDADR